MYLFKTLRSKKTDAIYFLIISIIPILNFGFRSIDDSIRVNGYVKGLASGKIIVTVKDLATIIKSDTINIQSEKFSYEIHCMYPHIVELNYNSQTTQSFVDPGTTLTFSANISSFSEGRFEGSKTENERIDRERQKIYRFNTEKPKTSMDSSRVSFTADSLWAMEHQQSYLTLMTLVNNIYDFKFIDVVRIYDEASDVYKKSNLGQKLLALIQESKVKPVGSFISELAWRNLNGERKNLKEFSKSKIKYVLLDFWGSYCIPCIQNIPLLKDLENKYRKFGLRIVSISVDKDENVWRKALFKEKIEKWIAGIEIADNSIQNQMGVETIPSYFIVDLNSGKIVGRFNTRSLRQGRADRLISTLLCR